MNITIQRVGENIIVAKDFSGELERGEIAHVLCELELLKLELLEIWEDAEPDKEETP